MIYLELLWSFFQIGLFSFGGGYAALPLIQYQVVELHAWLSMSQFADIMTIAEMTPGPVAINTATFVGIQMGGSLGAVIATLGCILPSCLIVMVFGYLYDRYRSLTMMQGILSGLRPAVIALIASAGISFLSLAFFKDDQYSLNGISIFIFVVVFILLRKWRATPIQMMAASGILGIFFYAIF